MRYLGGCTQCHAIWRGCRCPLRCEECGAGYHDDGNSTCGTPGCSTGERRHWMMQARWDEYRAAPAPDAIQCEASPDPAPPTPEAEPEHIADETAPVPPPAPAPAPRRRPSVQNGQARKPDARSAARPSLRTDEPTHRPVADRRAAVEALLTEGLSDREIAKRVKVSTSTVSAVRRDRMNAVSSVQGNP